MQNRERRYDFHEMTWGNDVITELNFVASANTAGKCYVIIQRAKLIMSAPACAHAVLSYQTEYFWFPLLYIDLDMKLFCFQKQKHCN